MRAMANENAGAAGGVCGVVAAPVVEAGVLCGAVDGRRVVLSGELTAGGTGVEGVEELTVGVEKVPAESASTERDRSGVEGRDALDKGLLDGEPTAGFDVQPVRAAPSTSTVATRPETAPPRVICRPRDTPSSRIPPRC